jgi:membrane protease YdiL (CAAX protease family)
MALLIEGGMGLLAVGLASWQDRPLIQPADWTWQNIAWGLAACLPPLIALWAIVRLPLPPFRRMIQVVDETVVPLFRSCGLQELAVISLLAGFGEEMLFRGVVQGSIGDWVGRWLGDPAGVWVGIAAAALLFGLLHPITTTYAVLAGLIGLYLGWLVLASGNLLVPATTHAIYDFLALVYLVKWRRKTAAS